MNHKTIQKHFILAVGLTALVGLAACQKEPEFSGGGGSTVTGLSKKAKADLAEAIKDGVEKGTAGLIPTPKKSAGEAIEAADKLKGGIEHPDTGLIAKYQAARRYLRLAQQLPQDENKAGIVAKAEESVRNAYAALKTGIANHEEAEANVKQFRLPVAQRTATVLRDDAKAVLAEAKAYAEAAEGQARTELANAGYKAPKRDIVSSETIAAKARTATCKAYVVGDVVKANCEGSGGLNAVVKELEYDGDVVKVEGEAPKVTGFTLKITDVDDKVLFEKEDFGTLEVPSGGTKVATFKY